MRSLNKKIIRLLLIVVLGIVGVAGYKINSNQLHFDNSKISNQSALVSSKENNSSDNNNTQNSNNSYGGITSSQYQKLANLNFKSGNSPVYVVNNNQSTLNPHSWTGNKVIYQNLDNLNRTSGSNTGFLEQRNVANSSLRVRQYIQPTGWHYNRRNDVQVYNRGHLIAYSVSKGIGQSGNYNPTEQSGDQNNPKNLFTQSAFSNQNVQTMYEEKVRSALRRGEKVIYQATPIFQGNDLMAKGINLQAISLNGNLNFNIYIFNVQPGYSFDYANGSCHVDRNMTVNWNYTYEDF